MLKMRQIIVVSLCAAAICGWLVLHESDRDKKSEPAIISTAPPAPIRSSSQSITAPQTPTRIIEPPTSINYTGAFDTQRNFWDFARKSLSSNDQKQVYEAVSAARECNAVLNLKNVLGDFSGGASTPLHGVLTPERQIAISSIMKKCEGFDRAGPLESKALLKSLIERDKYLGGTSLDAANAGDTPEARISMLKSVISDGSASQLTNALGVIASYWESAAGVHSPDPRALLMDTAAVLAACDLGRDCSSSSYPAEFQCAISGDCGDLWSNWKGGLSNEEVEAVKKYRENFVSAIKLRDWNTLGLGIKN